MKGNVQLKESNVMGCFLLVALVLLVLSLAQDQSFNYILIDSRWFVHVDSECCKRRSLKLCCFFHFIRDGLANRLRLLAAYMVVSEVVYNTSHIVMVWEVNEACNGHFLEIFQPLENVVFVTANQRQMFERNAIAQFGPSYAGFLEVLRRFELDTTPDHWHMLRREKYRSYHPVTAVLREVNQFVFRHNICKCIGVHARHTDLDKLNLHNHSNAHNDLSHFEFIDSFTSNQCVYLMTDNPTTQLMFHKRYGHRLLVYETIRDNSAHVGPHHRYTTLFHTVVDVLISAFSFSFHGSMGSSLSELVHLFNITFVNESDLFGRCSVDANKLPL